MNIINMILNLNKILWFFITWITVLESTVLKLQAALNKINIILKHVHSVIQEVSSKSISAIKNSYAMIVKLITYDIVMNLVMTKQSIMCLFTIIYSVKMLMSVSILNLKLFYTSAKFSEHQTHIIRDKCFDCDQKKHTQKNCSTYLFEKICFLLNLKMNQFMNSVSWIDMKINMKSSASFTVKIMKSVLNLIIKHVTISWLILVIL